MTDRYSVTIRRVNEGTDQQPQETLTANSLTVQRDGTLLIQGERGGQLLSSHLWDSFEVKRLV
jgi:hypothetical protein